LSRLAIRLLTDAYAHDLEAPTRTHTLSAAAAASLAGYTATGALYNISPKLTSLDQGLGRRIALIADLHIHRPDKNRAERALRTLEGVGSECFILGATRWTRGPRDRRPKTGFSRS